jgi:hypothetical protein
MVLNTIYTSYIFLLQQQIVPGLFPGMRYRRRRRVFISRGGGYPYPEEDEDYSPLPWSSLMLAGYQMFTRSTLEAEEEEEEGIRIQEEEEHRIQEEEEEELRMMEQLRQRNELAQG